MLQHVTNRTLYLKVDSGLGNRISPILFATRLLGLKYFERLAIKWENSNCSQFQLSDIFNICSDKIQIIDDLQMPWINSIHFELRPFNIIPWRYCTDDVYSGFSPMIVENDRNLSNDIILKEVLHYYPQYLQIRPEILQAVNEFNINNEYIGIHCRRTDVDLHWHIRPEYYKTVLPKLARTRDRLFSKKLGDIIGTDRKIFIASDDQITKEYYMTLFPNSIARDSKLPIGMWNIHPCSKKYGNWGQMLRLKADVIDAFIELLILSKCRFIVTDYLSSYAMTAHYLTGTKVYFLGKEDTLIRVRR